MLDFEFIKPKENKGSLKLTVQKTGKLGFSKYAINSLKLQNNRYCKFARDKESNGLYFLLSEEKDEYTYDISKAGEYYYIKAKSFLEEINIDYTNDNITIIFDMSRVEEQENVYELTKRVINKKKPSS